MSETGDTMLPKRSPFRIFFEKFAHELMGLRADRRGNIAVMMAFLLPVLVGFLGLGFEVTDWYLQTRYMQNAADSAAIAAATAAVRNSTPSSYVAEAKAVTAQYGFVDGANNVTVVPLDKQPCPSPSDGNNCYTVTITSRVQLWLSQVVGYAGDWTVSGVKGKKLSSAATAITPVAPLCLLALNTTGTAFQSNGGPKTDFTNCTIMSNSGATCNGSNLNATYGIAVGANGGGAGCGIGQTSNYGTPDLTPGCAEGRCYSTILANADGGQMSNDALALCNNNYPQVPTGGKNKGVWPTQLSALSQLPSFTGASDGTVYYVACGDTQLSGNITTPNALGGTPGYVLVVENGNLDLGNYTLSGPALSVVFSGTNSPTYGHAPTTGSGTNSFLDIHAPASGDWSGVALYQDPLVAGVQVTYAGNSPTWNINGLVYLPKSDLTISGAIGKSAYGGDCMVMVAGSVLINGTGSIYSQDPAGQACPQEGLIQDHVIAGRPAQLVY
jgi:Flp pilus assembly protein TadG